MAGNTAGALAAQSTRCVQGAGMFETRHSRDLWNQLNETIEESRVIPGCRDSDPEAWFPPETPGIGAAYNVARKLCAKCPVQRLCLEYAMANNEAHGLWGGLTHRERVKLKRKL